MKGDSSFSTGFDCECEFAQQDDIALQLAATTQESHAVSD